MFMHHRIYTIDKDANKYISLLASQDFKDMSVLFQPDLRFRALVPRRLCEGQSAVEGIEWLQRWFGDADDIQVLETTIERVFDRLYLSYRLRVHDVINGWRVIEQHAFAKVENSHINDIWLLCSGFRQDRDEKKSIM
jgi:hypothetical protein